MDELTFVLRVFLGTLFISTSVAKFRKPQEHMLTVKEYRILSSFLLYPFARAEMIVEFLTGILLFLGMFQKTVALLAVFLLAIYSLAIVVNLLRGRKEISCGCGGAAGDHPISWFLVLRNFLLIGMGICLYLNPTPWGSIEAIWNGEANQLFNLLVLQDILIAWLFLLMFAMTVDLRNLYKRFKRFLQS
ncbi:MauE/DoxX family redox-associated membrane protein [Brevibacillus borstelensis]|uniref:MauE/DoxX family redox-associated membrane protein n=1 Tax=Brevibacillus borstelensis TaxID=45462 RepID=UPI0030BAAE97